MTLLLCTYVVHTAGHVEGDVQRCAVCRVVIADERPNADLRRASALRYPRGLRVLVCLGRDYTVIGPIPLDERLPKNSTSCTAPVRSGSKDTRP